LDAAGGDPGGPGRRQRGGLRVGLTP
jgi:hypothetical protein